MRHSWSRYEGGYRRAALVWASVVSLSYLISNVWDVMNLVRFLVLDDPGPRI